MRVTRRESGGRRKALHAHFVNGALMADGKTIAPITWSAYEYAVRDATPEERKQLRDWLRKPLPVDEPTHQSLSRPFPHPGLAQSSGFRRRKVRGEALWSVTSSDRTHELGVKVSADREQRWAEDIKRRNLEEADRLQEERRQEREEANRREKERANRENAKECIHELAEILRTAFLVESCPRCYENRMFLISISPNARSIEYACEYCKRKLRAGAGSPDAQKVKDLEGLIVNAVGKEWIRNEEYRCTFSVPEGPLPYEQTTREPIPERIRTEVWRRDVGRCVKCGSRENLQFDHIIPVSKGGATTIHNLQLLCKSCNLSKSAKI